MSCVDTPAVVVSTTQKIASGFVTTSELAGRTNGVWIGTSPRLLASLPTDPLNLCRAVLVRSRMPSGRLPLSVSITLNIALLPTEDEVRDSITTVTVTRHDSSFKLGSPHHALVGRIGDLASNPPPGWGGRA